MISRQIFTSFYSRLVEPEISSHKGENGKALLIGGSDLFHAASQWSFEVISRLVDMAFYSSVDDNNRLLRAKQFIRNGVVVARSDVSAYLQEVDAVLIGPGMRRDYVTNFKNYDELQIADLTDEDWQNDTRAVTSVLLRQYSHKSWVIDAGALQVLERSWLPPGSILTPHQQEFIDLLGKTSLNATAKKKLLAQVNQLQSTLLSEQFSEQSMSPEVISLLCSAETKQLLSQFLQQLNQPLILLKGPVDLIIGLSPVASLEINLIAVVGGNPGLTKGGTGDVLAGLITGFLARSNLTDGERPNQKKPDLNQRFEVKQASLVVSSYLNKLAAHELYQRQGLMFNTSDLVDQIPLTWRKLLHSVDE